MINEAIRLEVLTTKKLNKYLIEFMNSNHTENSVSKPSLS